MPRVAVTGASGFIGRHVVEALAATPSEIVLSSRTPEKLSRYSGRATLVEIDLGRPEGAFERLGRPDVLIHLAWDGLPDYSALRHIETELPRQFAFLRRLLADGLANLTVTGTCLEYGLQSGALAETAPCDPSTPYGFAKYALCRQLELVRQSAAYNLTWARLFYTYGEGQAPTSLWSQLSAALARGDQVFDMSGGQQLRDFLPIATVADLIVRLALRQQDIGRINVASGEPQSVRSLVESWVAAAGSPIGLNLGRYPYPDYEPMAFWGDAQKLRAILGPSDHP